MNNWSPQERIGAVIQVVINRSKRANNINIGYDYLEAWNIKYGNVNLLPYLLELFKERIN